VSNELDIIDVSESFRFPNILTVATHVTLPTNIAEELSNYNIPYEYFLILLEITFQEVHVPLSFTHSNTNT